MRIAQFAPLYEAVPPKLYGGTERVVSWLTEELVALGHDVTLFASGDSSTSAKLEAFWPRALRLDGAVRDPNALHIIALRASLGTLLRPRQGPKVAQTFFAVPYSPALFSSTYSIIWVRTDGGNCGLANMRLIKAALKPEDLWLPWRSVQVVVRQVLAHRLAR
jgi:hypothetical protein